MIKKLFFALAGLVLLGGAVIGVVWWVFPPHKALALVEQRASQLLNTPVKASGVQWALRPTPQLVIDGVRTTALKAPLSVQALAVVLNTDALLRGQLEILRLEVQSPSLSQDGLAELAAQVASTPSPSLSPPTSEPTGPAVLPALNEIFVRDLQWRSAQGLEAQLDADLALEPQALRLKSFTARIAQGQSSGTGELSWRGPVSAPQSVALKLSLATRGVSVQALQPQGKVSGRLDADSQVSAEVKAKGSGAPAAAWGRLLDAMVTQSDVNIRQAVLRGVDLGKTVTTAGAQRDGDTALDTLSARVNTRGAPSAMAVAISNLQAKSGALGVQGSVQIAPNRALSGQLTVDAAGGWVAVPVLVSGSLDEPRLGFSRATLLGAAIGTAILPGAGTAAGAQLGDKVGSGLQSFKDKLFAK